MVAHGLDAHAYLSHPAFKPVTKTVSKEYHSPVALSCRGALLLALQVCQRLSFDDPTD